MPLCRTVPVGTKLIIGPFYVAVVFQEPSGLVGLRTSDGRRFTLRPGEDVEVFPSVVVGLAPASRRRVVCLAVTAPLEMHIGPLSS